MGFFDFLTNRSNERGASVRDITPEFRDSERGYNINPQATREFFLPPRLGYGGRLTQPYRQHGMTYAASRAISTNIAQVPFLLHVGQDENDEEVVRDGPWVELFDQPNPCILTRSSFWEATILQMLDRGGVSVWVKEGAGDQRIKPGEIPTELWPISGQMFRAILNDVTKLPAFWEYRPPGQNKAIIYAPHELVFHRFTNPYNPTQGIGPYEAAELAYTQDYKAARYNEAFFDNDATPGGLLIKEQGTLTEPQKNALKEAWEERHAGIGKRRRIALLEGGLKYEETGSTHREMEFEKGRAFAWKEELAVLGVPEQEVGLTQNINFATAQVISKDFVTKRLLPIMRIIEDGAWVQLFKPVEGEGERVKQFSDHRMQVRRRQAVHMKNPRFVTSLLQQRGKHKYSEYRGIKTIIKDGKRVGFEPVRVNTHASLWGEFDLTSIEALREDYGDKLDQARKAMGIGVTFNDANERLDLGFEKLEGESGETSFVENTLTPMDLKINPPEPTVVAPPGAPGSKPAQPSKDDTKKPADATAKEDAADAKQKMVADKVLRFMDRRPAEYDQRWMAIIKKTKPIEDKFRAKYKRWLMDLRAELLKNLQRHAPPVRDLRVEQSDITKSQIEGILFDQTGAAQRLKTLAHGIYVEASQAGIESAMNDLGGNFAFDVVDPKVVDAISKRELILSSSTATLRNRVKKSMEKGVENGESINQLQDRLRTEFNSFSGTRSLMIARTEVAAATNTARNLAFEEEGVESTRWITARDEAVRDSHAEIDGDTAAVGEEFDNGLLYPGDPAGPPGEVINCRCVAIPVVGRK